MKVKERESIGSKDLALKLLKKGGLGESAMVSSLTGVPMIFILLWYKEEIEESEEVDRKIDVIMKFYRYTVIERIK